MGSYSGDDVDDDGARDVPGGDEDDGNARPPTYELPTPPTSRSGRSDTPNTASNDDEHHNTSAVGVDDDETINTPGGGESSVRPMEGVVRVQQKGLSNDDHDQEGTMDYGRC